MNEINKNITIFYNKNGVDHARLDFDVDFGEGRMVHKARYVNKKELEVVIQKLCMLYNMPLEQLQQIGIVKYVNYQEVDESVKKSEKILKNQDSGYLIANTTDVKSRTADVIQKVEERLKKSNYRGIKFGSLALALVIAATSTGYVIKKHNSPEAKRNRAVNTAVSMLKNENDLSTRSIDEMLEIFTMSSYNDRLYAKTFGREFLSLLKYNSNISKDVVDRFEDLYSFTVNNEKREKPDFFTYNFCLYGISLINGGDNYSYDLGSLPQILKGSSPVQKEMYIDGITSKYNVSRRRVEYAATSQEANLFKGLPPIARVIMLTQLEDQIRRTNFTPQPEDYPTWWVGLHKKDSYNTERILNEISEMRANAIEEVYSKYSNESQRKK